MPRPGAPGCAYMVPLGPAGQPRPCYDEVLYAVAWRSPTTRKRWRLFVCAEHLHLHPDARPLTDADRVALQLRRARFAQGQRGGPWIPPRPLRE